MTRYPRLLACALLICVPVLLLGGFGAYFLFDKVPNLELRERQRIMKLYRDIAGKLAGHPEDRDFELPARPKSSSSHVRRLKNEWRWDVVEAARVPNLKTGMGPGDVLVWIETPGGKVMATRAEGVDVREYAVFYWAVPAVWFLMLVMTVFCVYIFYSFAKERDDFIHATVHDLRTPVAALGVLTAGNANSDLKLVAERMRRMVQNLTDFLNLGGKRPAPKRERVDLVALYREAYGLFKNDYEDDYAPVAVEGEESIEATADPDLVLQIYWNLLGNDLKYAAPYGPVKVRFSRTDGGALVEFLDEGKGMTPRQMKRAFDRYYRAKTVIESGKGGFGIGLCTSREFARLMGGDLTVRANSPRGCVFSLILPRQAKSAANRAENMI